MSKILDLRTTDLSIYYFLNDHLSDDGYIILSGHSYDYVTSGIYLIDGYPDTTKEMGLPTIAIEHQFTNEESFQLGPGRTDVRKFTISVFCRTDGERDDMSERVRNYFSANSVSIYDYNIVLSGGTSDVLAKARAENIVSVPYRSERPIRSMQHIMEVSFDLEVDIGSGYSLIT